MEKSSYNGNISVLLCLIFIATLFIRSMYRPYNDIECSKIKNSCSIYTRSVLKPHRILEAEFNISDIKSHEIIKYRTHGHKGVTYTSYKIVIYLNNGHVVYLYNRAGTHKRAEEIYNSMVNNDDYILKGSYWHTLFNNY